MGGEGKRLGDGATTKWIPYRGQSGERPLAHFFLATQPPHSKVSRLVDHTHTPHLPKKQMCSVPLHILKHPFVPLFPFSSPSLHTKRSYYDLSIHTKRSYNDLSFSLHTKKDRTMNSPQKCIHSGHRHHLGRVLRAETTPPISSYPANHDHHISPPHIAADHHISHDHHSILYALLYLALLWDSYP